MCKFTNGANPRIAQPDPANGTRLQVQMKERALSSELGIAYRSQDPDALSTIRTSMRPFITRVFPCLSPMFITLIYSYK
jgi:hypothetical protein